MPLFVPDGNSPEMTTQKVTISSRPERTKHHKEQDSDEQVRQISGLLDALSQRQATNWEFTQVSLWQKSWSPQAYLWYGWVGTDGSREVVVAAVVAIIFFLTNSGLHSIFHQPNLLLRSGRALHLAWEWQKQLSQSGLYYLQFAHSADTFIQSNFHVFIL